ncbi:hypothetical protein LTR62_001153 [Meristemomyces frigidus]|uniref:Uncharacterized protein n=1 Tax=Meristemomyces frigidus TaxID=1508187 RepID=A0AAN7YIC2_9PEZI|nr:hypothetical protein LTR62_001153 [Meristemomyces frigidus]
MESIVLPSKDNDFLGFCPSAVKLQNGDRKNSLKKRTDYQDSYSSSGVSTFCCADKKCAFQSHVSVDFVWKVVQKDQDLGLQCRWAFLAKSHVQQGMVRGREYQYQCPICVFSYGHAEGRTWRGTNIYLDHVSTHRGQEIAPEILQKLNISNDHVCDDKENFDLNLFPPGLESRSGYGSSDSSLTLSRIPTHSSVHTSVLEKVWGRKDSTATVTSDNSHASYRTPSLLVRERSDSAIPGAEKEGTTRIEHSKSFDKQNSSLLSSIVF